MNWQLTDDETAPFTLHHRAGRAPYLLVADHAGARVPAALGELGLPAAAFARHIAVDIGVRALTTELCQRLDARAVLANYSRLVIDLNRTLDSPTCVPPSSDGWTVPGNANMSALDFQSRVSQLFRPYHDAVRGAIGELESDHAEAGIIAIHSFTPAMDGFERPWHVGILWSEDARLARPALNFLREQPGLQVGDNQPYSARGPEGYTMPEHAERPGRPHLLVEVRQDQLLTDAGIARWSALLAATIEHAWAALDGQAAR
ncbi:MAG: N-formylglutamate amidohydrolase [Pseudomonadota bacterium]